MPEISDGLKIALVVTAVVGMLVGAIGLTAASVSVRDDDVTRSLAVNSAKKSQHVLEENQALDRRVTIVETNYAHIITLLEKIETRLDER